MDYDAEKIRSVYYGLWRIEESFRIMKSDLDARPIYVNIREHIWAHFLICFTALVIVRMIQHSMGEKRLSAERIADCLRAANCLIEQRGYVRLLDVGGKIGYQEIQETFGTDLNSLLLGIGSVYVYRVLLKKDIV